MHLVAKSEHLPEDDKPPSGCFETAFYVQEFGLDLFSEFSSTFIKSHRNSPKSNRISNMSFNLPLKSTICQNWMGASQCNLPQLGRRSWKLIFLKIWCDLPEDMVWGGSHEAVWNLEYIGAAVFEV